MDESSMRIDCRNNSNNNTGVKNPKCESHSKSPTGSLMAAENANSQQRQQEENTNKINIGTSSDNLHSSRDSTSDTQRKNSNSTNTSGSSLHASPTLPSNNNNDNSNSSNSTISQLVDATDASIGQQQSQESKPVVSDGIGVNKTYNADEANDDNANTNTSSGNDDNVNLSTSESSKFINAQCISKDNSSSSTPSSASVAVTKDEPVIQTVLGNLVNVKKEQGSVETPVMSPDSFGPLPSLTSNGTVVPGGVSSTGTSATNLNLLVNAGNSHANLDNTNNNRSSNLIGSGGTNTCVGNLLNDDTTNEQHSLNQNNNFGANVSIMSSNSIDYTQQQNHIFVFSTQLANRGAESVLSGQFPTIIAFHCTQPATKKFLDDFFLKNPMKMAKMQRHNSLHMTISGSPISHQWMSGSMPGNTPMLIKNNQKLNGSRSHAGPAGVINNICNNSGLDSGANLSNDAEELMPWEQTNIDLSGISSNSNACHALNISENSDKIVVSPHSNSSPITQQSPNKTIGTLGNPASATSPGDNLQPSLQGVKVPDENLTPQQRQHRVEQLAKLKKMNQFLFPEHGSDMLPDAPSLQTSNQISKLNAGSIITNNSGTTSMALMLGDSSSSAGNQIKGTNGTTNVIVMGRQSAAMGRNSLNLNASAAEETGISTAVGGLADVSNIHCGNLNSISNNIIMNSQQGLPCRPRNVLETMGSSSLLHDENNQDGVLSHENMNNINLIQNCGSSGTPTPGLIIQGIPSKGSMGGTGQLDSGIGQTSQIEWSKMQQFYDGHTTKNKGNMDVISGLNRSVSNGGGGPYNRSSQTGTNINSTLNSTNSGARSQGPPPPYHQTQRSASVPIATQSPNPASPNNPTSNLSLPSPRTASGTSATNLPSPSSESHVLSSSATTPTTSVGTSVSISEVSFSTNNQCKSYQQEDSPTGLNSKSLGGSGNNLRNSLTQFNSNPSTPLSNMSPKDLDNMSTCITDIKNPRPSPQRSRTPHLMSNNSTDSTSVEGRFPPASPGNSFAAHLQNQANGSKISNSSNEISAQSAFGRRPDNLPLNPNSSRSAPIKHNLQFDPISSLAQMSQQLTSCVSSNSGIGGSNSIGINNSMPGEMVVGQNMEGLLRQSGPMDGNIDHCGNVSGLSPHMLGSSQYGGGNCHGGGPINNPMGSRLHTPKMAPGFSGSGPNAIREGPIGFHGGIPPHRMMGRMGVGFCPFNGSPNIQVKASTPNTIQYMPVRPQTSNANPRMPPSLEFLQRFANPQLTGSPNIDGPKMVSGASGNSDINKISNTSLNPSIQNSSINFFPNGNQIGGGSAGNNSGNISVGSQLDIATGMMPGLSDIGMNMGNPLSGMNIRGIRPTRQGTMGPCGSPGAGISHRMQGPGPHISEVGIAQFGNALHDADSNSMFISPPGGPNQIYGQQKGSPISGQTHCPNISPGNGRMHGPVGSAGFGANEQGSSMQAQMNNSNSLMLGPVCGSPNNSPANYKSTNDMKYAQQYHNFQQQLYATSTRSQLNQQIGGAHNSTTGGGINIPTNANSSFFVGK